ncbi:MAG: 2-oxoacid:acceptor oxidoreductase family protein, partial [Roseiflexaceae bacterium]|nr:2-oxoacid:acceptor oxidoreductase family protein [Roseiflexaceae bacterium]
GPDEVWDQLPRKVQEEILEKDIKLYVIDAYKVARENGMAGRINTVMQTCFFAISDVLPHEEAIEQIKESIRSAYRKKGEGVIAKNLAA